MTRKLWNLVFYGKWTDCRHDWAPEGFADWKCSKCIVRRLLRLDGAPVARRAAYYGNHR